MPRFPKLVVVAVAAATLACSGLSRESGVCLPNKLDKQAWSYIEDKGLVSPGENVLAYYDATVSLDGSEIALLTDQRAIYHLDGRTTSLPWSEVTAIERVEVPMADGFLLSAANGQTMQIEIAVLNGGDVWERVQMQAWRAAGGGRPEAP